MPNRKFHLFHLNLMIMRGPLFQKIAPTREEYLRSVLERDFEFSIGRGKNYSRASWIYKGAVGECILGTLLKEGPHQRHLPPEEGGDEVITQEWQGAWVIIDPTHHKKGQRASVEVDVDVVGTPKSLLIGLVGQINKNKDRPYNITPDLIFNGNNFWDYAKKANNKFTKVQFDFDVPNMHGTKKEIANDLKEAGVQTGAENISITYKSSKGINALSERIKSAVEYIEKGQGKIKAFASGLRSFDSDANPTITEMPNSDRDKNQGTKQFNKHKGEVLGHDGDVSDNSDSNDTA